MTLFANRPAPGYWLLRLPAGVVGKVRRKGPAVPAAIISIDHEPGDPDNKLDTGPIFVGYIGLREVDPLDVWHYQSEDRISAEDYELRVAQMQWDRDYAADRPELAPHQPIDFTKLPPIGPSE
jgi:hypothetical protein